MFGLNTVLSGCFPLEEIIDNFLVFYNVGNRN